MAGGRRAAALNPQAGFRQNLADTNEGWERSLPSFDLTANIINGPVIQSEAYFSGTEEPAIRVFKATHLRRINLKTAVEVRTE
jgi:hypothetical protein